MGGDQRYRRSRAMEARFAHGGHAALDGDLCSLLLPPEPRRAGILRHLFDEVDPGGQTEMGFCASGVPVTLRFTGFSRENTRGSA